MADPTSTDPVTWKEFAAAAAATISALVAWITSAQTKRIEVLETETKDFASKKDFDQHERDDRETFTNLFAGQKEGLEAMNKGFADMNATMHGIHTSLLTELTKKADK